MVVCCVFVVCCLLCGYCCLLLFVCCLRLFDLVSCCLFFVWLFVSVWLLFVVGWFVVGWLVVGCLLSVVCHQFLFVGRFVIVG